MLFLWLRPVSPTWAPQPSSRPQQWPRHPRPEARGTERGQNPWQQGQPEPPCWQWKASRLDSNTGRCCSGLFLATSETSSRESQAAGGGWSQSTTAEAGEKNRGAGRPLAAAPRKLQSGGKAGRAGGPTDEAASDDVPPAWTSSSGSQTPITI